MRIRHFLVVFLLLTTEKCARVQKSILLAEQINPNNLSFAGCCPGYQHHTDCCTTDLPFLDCHKFSYSGLYLPHLQIYVGFY